MSDKFPPMEGPPRDATELDASMTPTDATTNPAAAAHAERRIDADIGLSAASEQPGAGAITGIRSRAADRLFRD